MKQQILRTMIVLSGNVDNSFGRLGAALTNLGSQVDTLSRQVIDFGKESLESYAGYDDTMRYVQSLGELDQRTREALDDYNRTIAQTSRYTMDQAAQAEMMMAQLGLSVEEIKTLMPTVMDTATAANIDLATSLNYLYYSLNALGMPMSAVNVLSDQMAKTSAISAADINTLGLSLQRLGSGAQFFAGGSSEILAILGGIAQFGEDMQGSDAGTQLRNFMLTLMAPTGSKETLMEQMGVTEEMWAEFESYMDDAEINVTDTADAMNELGLTIYDQATGKIKPAIQIIGELSAALGSMDEESQNKALGQLFGKRTTTTAKNLIASMDTIIAYQKEIKERSAGYTDYMAETVDGGIGGMMRIAEAAFGALENRIGGVLAPDAMDWLEGMTGFVNSVTGMDDEKLEMLVGAAEGVAAAGPALLLAGGAFRLIGSLLTPGGAIAAGAVTLAALASAMEKLYSLDFEDKFGELELDEAGMKSYIDTLGGAAQEASKRIGAFNTEIEKAIKDYETASGTLKGDLLTGMLTGATLTQEDINRLNGLGEQMAKAIRDGIDNNYAADIEAITNAFGGDEAAQDNPMWEHIRQVMKIGYQSAIEQASSLSQQLRAAMTSAFADGQLTQAEIESIQSIIDQQNELLAMQTSASNYAAQQSMLRKAQTMGLDGLKNLSAMEAERQQQVMEGIYQQQDNAYGALAAQLDWQVRQGMVLDDGTAVTREYADRMLAELKQRQTQEAARYRLDFMPFTRNLYDTVIGESELADGWSALRTLAGQAMDKGVLTGEDYSAYISGRNAIEQRQIGDLMDWYVEAMGGEQRILEDIDALMSTAGKTAEQIAADQESAGYLQNLLTMYGIENRGMYGYDQAIGNAYADAQGYDLEAARRQMLSLNADGMMTKIAGFMMNAIESGSADKFEQNVLYGTLFAQAREGLDSVVERLKGVAEFSEIEVPDGLEGIADYVRAFELMYGNPLRRPGISLEGGGMSAEEWMAGAGQTTGGDVRMNVGTPDAQVEASEWKGEFQGGLDSDPPDLSIKKPDGYADGVNYVTMYEIGLNSKKIRFSFGNEKTVAKYAGGGRADRASIFGEAGPEWAVPEEHTQRTASLLDQARRASGFSWPELIARNGGLNAGGGARTQLVYSPTIVVRDASGVERALDEDKRRLDRWWEEKQMMERMEAFA
ncbi:MAG: phage tail tape measure protein [Candidatus Ventricola sp.]